MFVSPSVRQIVDLLSDVFVRLLHKLKIQGEKTSFLLKAHTFFTFIFYSFGDAVIQRDLQVQLVMSN